MEIVIKLLIDVKDFVEILIRLVKALAESSDGMQLVSTLRSIGEGAKAVFDCVGAFITSLF